MPNPIAYCNLSSAATAIAFSSGVGFFFLDRAMIVVV